MTRTQHLTALIEREGDGYVALCLELDVASQGDTVEEARRNLKEAVELFVEGASPTEVDEQRHGEVYVTRLEVALAWNCASSSVGRRVASWRRRGIRRGDGGAATS
jgi:predicted RNase H-like HicB family nuclease